MSAPKNLFAYTGPGGLPDISVNEVSPDGIAFDVRGEGQEAQRIVLTREQAHELAPV